MFVFVHARAYPMFAVMFGYGLVQLTRRQDAQGAGPGAARSVLLKRNAWLIAFGLVHAALLDFGDFLGAYGIVGILFTLVLLRRGERVQRVVLWLWGWMVVYVAVVAGMAVYTPRRARQAPPPYRRTAVSIRCRHPTTPRPWPTGSASGRSTR
ncbi:hypothetical protein SANTM175S_06824 [Streptomyces antimycoticus]